MYIILIIKFSNIQRSMQENKKYRNRIMKFYVFEYNFNSIINIFKILKLTDD